MNHKVKQNKSKLAVKRSLLWLIFFSLTCVTNGQQTQSELNTTISLPPFGWTLYPKPAANSPEMLCGNYSDREWFVSLQGKELQIQRKPQQTYRRDPLPFKIRLKKSNDDGIDGRRYVQKLKDGWLVGFDKGEFGGSLWWFSINGKKHKKLSNGNIKYFVNLSDQMFVLEGLAHLTSASGNVLRVVKAASGEYSVEVVAELDGEPYGYAQESRDSLLIITTSGLRRMKTTGVVEKLIETDYGILYPNSMALTQDNIVYIGMKHFVTRLIPTIYGYKEEWLVPTDCPNFEVNKDDLDCTCLPSKKK